MKYLLWLVLIITPATINAGVFGEHKLIGDKAFERLMKLPKAKEFFRKYKNIYLNVSDFKFPEGYSENPLLHNPDSIYILKINDSYGISYGDLTGLSGDHSDLPETIMEALFELDTSGIADKVLMERHRQNFLGFAEVMEARLLEHHNAILNHKKCAENNTLSTIYLAYEDQSHFYAPGKPIAMQLKSTADMKLLSSHFQDLETSIEFIRKNYFRMNAISKYVFIHTLACHYAELAGKEAADNGDTKYAMHLFLIALLHNAFADHFLQDSFAAGHIVTRRSHIIALDNRGKHNYFNRTGLEVKNAKGKEWRTYGDYFYNEEQDSIAAEANYHSLFNLWDRYEHYSDYRKKYSGPSSIVIYLSHLINDEPVDFFIESFGALSIIPEPQSPFDLNNVDFGFSRNGLIISTGYEKNFRPSSDMNVFQVGLGLGYIFDYPDFNADPQYADYNESEFYLELAASLLMSQGLKPGVSVNLNSVSYDWLLLGIGYNFWNINRSIVFRAGGDFKKAGWFLGFSPYIELQTAFNGSPAFSTGIQLKLY